MCGIAGFVDLSGRLESDRLHEIAGRMAATLRHRGPDDAGVWVDPDTRIALGHQRLAIQDLSSEGHQPMQSVCGRFVIAFNGEIYNFLDLRRELERLGSRFRGHSDTEVMLAAIAQWGPRVAVTRFNGMFAFALWDRHDRVLHLGRDRLGEKPLYYSWQDDAFTFGSELKALRAHPGFQGEIDRDALCMYFRRNYVPAPFSIYRDVYKLQAGCVLSIPTPTAKARESFSPFPDAPATHRPAPYWSLFEVATHGAAHPFGGSPREATDHLESLLRDAVALRMKADVPLGAFLSGGIDSSTIVALMQAASNRPIHTFSIGSEEPEYDESAESRAVAHHLGTNHTELIASASDALRVIPTLPALYDEPFSDSSQIPAALVAQLARRSVVVSVSGDGGDELFAGYNLYFQAQRLWASARVVPPVVRQMMARVLTLVPPQAWDKAFAACGAVLPPSMRQSEPGDKLHRLAEILPAPSSAALYDNLMSRWRAPTDLVRYSREPVPGQMAPAVPNLPHFIPRMMYSDLMTYLPDDLLVKIDRAGMGAGLEVRVPLLDHRLVEFAWQLPLSLLIQGGRGKWLLRRVLYRHVPATLVDRPKRGFSVPLSAWLRGPLRDWAESVLDAGRLHQDGYLNAPLVRQRWSEHLSERRNWSRELWEILMFQTWLESVR